MSTTGRRRSVEVRSLWDAHDVQSRGFLDAAELRRLLDSLRKKLGASGALSDAAAQRCAALLRADEDTGELRQEDFGRRFTQLWAQKEELLELPQATEVKRGSFNDEAKAHASGEAAEVKTGSFNDEAKAHASVEDQEPTSADGFDLATEMPQELFAVGSVCSVRKSAIKMRKGEDLASAVIKDIPGPNQGLNAARLLVLKRGAEGRLQVQDSHGDVGWVSSTSTEGRRLLQPSSAWLLGDDLESSRAAVRELWRSQVRAQEEGGDFVSEMLAAHHCALENDARRWRLVQEVEDVKQELEDEEETCKASVKKLRAELKLQEAKEPAHEVAALQAEAHQEKIAAEDARQALLVAQQKSAEQTSRLDELQEEVKQAQERRLRSDQSAQYKLQVLEDEQEQRSFKSSEDLRRAKEHARAEAAALDQCEMKLESLEKKERTRALFENVQVEFDRKEKQSKEELREATQLRNEAAMAADEALALRVKLMREDQDLQSQKTSLNHLEQQAAQKLEAATGELDRARSLTQELSKDKAEAFQELAEARRTSARSEAERELAHQQSLEAEMAAYEAMKACDAADEDRKKVEAALLQVTEDLERAARSQRQGQDLFAKGEASTQKFQTLEAQASHYSAESRRLAQALATEQAQCKECRSEKDRAQHG